MGCFDTVHFRCPHCGERNSEQSKAGDRGLQDYDISNAPPEILCDIVGDSYYGEPRRCEHCNERIVLQLINRPVVMAVKPPYEFDDEEEEFDIGRWASKKKDTYPRPL